MIQKMGIMGNIFRYLPNSIYGYDIAVKDALSAILRYGTFQSLVVFYDPRQYQEHIIRKTIKELQNRDQINAEIEFISTYELLKGSSQPQFDVMHNIGMEFLPQIYYRENISNTPFPYIYTLHCASSPNYRNDLFFQKLLSPFHHYDSLICTSEASKRAVQAILNNISNSIAEEYNIHLKYKGRLDVIPLGVDTNYFAPLSDMQRKDNRAKYNIPKSAFVLLWMGRISALDKADLQPLIMVLYRLIRKNHDKKIMLIIAGYDKPNLEFVPSIKAYAESLGIIDNLIFINPEQNERNEVYNLADVYVAPTDNIQETFGLAPLEAMACGLPQIVADWDGYRDTVKHEFTGFRIPSLWSNCDSHIKDNPIFPIDPVLRGFLHAFILSQTVSIDLDYFVKAVQLLIDSPELRKKQSMNSIAQAKQRFDWSVIVTRYSELWDILHEDCLNSKKTPAGKLQHIVPHYCSEFASYATDFLDTNTKVTITFEGIQVLNGEISLPTHYKFEPLLIDNKDRLSVLKMLSGKGKTVNALKSEMRNTISERDIEANIMWLLKNGFARLQKEI